MIVYRIVKQKGRATDLSGIGSYNYGGRWNTPGTYALYTSASRALAALELLVHIDEAEAPRGMSIMSMEVNDLAPIYPVPDAELPKSWRSPENSALKNIGDKLLSAGKFAALKVRSAVMLYEFNYILNPRYPGFADLVKVIEVEEFNFDERLL